MFSKYYVRVFESAITIHSTFLMNCTPCLSGTMLGRSVNNRKADAVIGSAVATTGTGTSVGAGAADDGKINQRTTSINMSNCVFHMLYN